MKQFDTLHLLLLDLMAKWEEFVLGTRQHSGFERLSEHDKGFVMGFEAATREVRTLIAQVNGLSAEYAIEGELAQTTQDGAVLEWEYLYVTFEQTPTGIWQIKSITGGEELGWEDTLSFDEAVQQLRSVGGWRLTNFAKGIHVFRRPLNYA